MHPKMHFAIFLTATAIFTFAPLALAGQAVKAIQWTNVGVSATYNEVTNMAPNGVCSSKPRAFSGPIAPFDEELSLHFRGPMALKQVAVYMPSVSKKRENSGTHRSHRAHAHQRFHERLTEKLSAEVVERAVEDFAASVFKGQSSQAVETPAPSPSEGVSEEKRDMVVITMNGQVVSWENNWFGPPATAIAAVVPNPASTTLIKVAPNAPPPAAAAVVPAPVVPVSPQVTPPAPASSVSSSYTRTGYYDSKSQYLDGLTFLGNHGGQGSGVFDNTYGLSLAYANSAGTAGASGPTVLADTVIPSNSEVIIFTDRKCTDSSCGYTRPGSVAYHGFAGSNKIFLLEFSMPSASTQGFNADMPAIWALNAQIPRTLQYGDASCSCWKSGGGEFDIMEVLSPGSLQCTSSFHGHQEGTEPNYIQRPTTNTIKVAVVFSAISETVQIQVLPDSMSFGTGLSSAQVSALLASTPGQISKWSAS